MTDKTIEKQIRDIVQDAERMYNARINDAVKLADEHGTTVDAGEYGVDGRTYYSPASLEKLKKDDPWMYSAVIYDHPNGGWISSSSMC